MVRLLLFVVTLGLAVAGIFGCQDQRPPMATSGTLVPMTLRCEYLVDPDGIESLTPRLNWVVESTERGQKQTAWQVLVASSSAALAANNGDLWDSGRVADDRTVGITYAGRPLTSGKACFWKVHVWDRDGRASGWSVPARWSMGLLAASDWKGTWISVRDDAPVNRDLEKLYLPPARMYRTDFTATKPIKRAVLHGATLGLGDFHLNGNKVDDEYFASGWADYRQRAYYRTWDVTAQMHQGANRLGVVLADGWYAGYVGYSLFVGYGPYKNGRNHYGKTPALHAQLDIEYVDGTSTSVVSDPGTWQVTSAGPWREADMLMGEHYDARLEQPGWSQPGATGPGWEPVVRAEDQGPIVVPFFDNRGERRVNIGFQAPLRLQAYPGVKIRAVREIVPKAITEPAPGVYIFNLGENVAGNIRLAVKGAAGTALTIRYGEMLHPDGRLMTENLRKARATDTYILKGDAQGETWTPRFTYHGFQFVEISGLPSKPELGAVTGLVMHSDTPVVGSFACSDPLMNQLIANIQRTQLANFIEVPTDCPQRDERLGWMGDAAAYVRSASLNADVSAFFTKWLDDVVEAQLPEGAYPDYCPYPMGHGQSGKNFGTAWTDAGIICPWTIFQVYGDTRLMDKNWVSMTRFMEWRKKSAPDLRGVSIGNPWGDWLNINEETPIEYIDAAYFAFDAGLMADMAAGLGKTSEADMYRALRADIIAVFQKDYLKTDGTLTIDTQTAHVLALAFGLVPDGLVPQIANRLAAKIEANGFAMATGFLGTGKLLPTLSAHGHHDLAVRLFQSRKFPSWGYEVVNGATSVWERWDSYTKEDGFGRHNAAMNSYSHYAFGAVCEWMYRDLAGIASDGSGFSRIVIKPAPPTAGNNPDVAPITAAKAEYRSIRGLIVSDWQVTGDQIALAVTIPANTTATVYVPTVDPASIRENGKPVTEVAGIQVVRREGTRTVLNVVSGTWNFTAQFTAK